MVIDDNPSNNNEPQAANHINNDDVYDTIWKLPEKSIIRIILWLLMWPASFLFNYTIPDCRKQNLRKWFLVSFAFSVSWIGGLTYLCVWMVTIIGN